MYKIKKLNVISPEGLTTFPLDQYEIGTEITHPDAIILRSYKMHDMELPISLLAVGVSGQALIMPQLTRRIIDVAYPARNLWLFFVISALLQLNTEQSI